MRIFFANQSWCGLFARMRNGRLCVRSGSKRCSWVFPTARCEGTPSAISWATRSASPFHHPGNSKQDGHGLATADELYILDLDAASVRRRAPLHAIDAALPECGVLHRLSHGCEGGVLQRKPCDGVHGPVCQVAARDRQRQVLAVSIMNHVTEGLVAAAG